MKKNRQFLLALMVIVLPFCFTACSDNNDSPDEPVTPPDPVKTAIAFSVPDFANSYVYLVTDGNQKLAEISNEYIPAFSKDKRATVVYPFGKDGKVDHTKGIVVDNGGSVSWNGGTCTYKAGSLAALKTLYVDSNLIRTAGDPLKTVTATPDKLKDADNNEYKIVKIGNQYWIGENFKSTKFKDGKSILTTSDPAGWCDNTTGAYLVYTVEDDGSLPDDLSSPAKIKANYGLLYNWAAAKAVAPVGWHLPLATEWESLRTYLGDTEEVEEPAAGGMLKEMGLAHWNAATGWDDNDNEVNLGNVGATNVTGFTAVGNGYVYMVFPNMGEISYGSIKTEAAWFTASEEDGMIVYFGISNGYASLDDNYGETSGAMAVRLVRD